jgi:hypothetical protein
MTTLGAKYFVCADGKQLGPFTGQQVRTKLFRKTITPYDYIWREGLGDQWVPIRSILDELPPDAIPPPAPEIPKLRQIKITHPDGTDNTLIEVPEKGVYEPPATLKQKNLLMKFGCNNPEAIRHIGRDQASYVIDRFREDCSEMFARHLVKEQRAKTKSQAIAALAVLSVVIVVVAVYSLANRPISEDSQSANSAAAPTPVAARAATLRPQTITLRRPQATAAEITPRLAPSTPAASVQREQFATITQPVTISIPYGRTVLRPGMKLKVVSRTNDAVVVRYMDGTYPVPISTTDLK